MKNRPIWIFLWFAYFPSGCLCSLWSEPADTITNVLMHRVNHYPSKRLNAELGPAKQCNALITFLTTKKFGVHAGNLSDYEDLVKKFAEIMWEIDPHYIKLKSQGLSNWISLVLTYLLLMAINLKLFYLVPWHWRLKISRNILTDRTWC